MIDFRLSYECFSGQGRSDHYNFNRMGGSRPGGTRIVD